MLSVIRRRRHSIVSVELSLGQDEGEVMVTGRVEVQGAEAELYQQLNDHVVLLWVGTR